MIIDSDGDDDDDDDDDSDKDNDDVNGLNLDDGNDDRNAAMEAVRIILIYCQC